MIFNGSHFTLNRKMDTGVIYFSWVLALLPKARKAYPNLFETIELIKNEQVSTDKTKLLDKTSKSKDLLPDTGFISFSTNMVVDFS